jgi:hypothetical protein
MKLFNILILLLVVSACNNAKSDRSLSINNIKYSAYSWHYVPDKDSFEFYLASYLSIDNNGTFVVMRHDSFMDTPKYFGGSISDTIRKKIDSMFEQPYSPVYTYSPDTPIIYDGFSYFIDYVKKDSERKTIQFIPKFSPLRIQELSNLLDTLIYSRAVDKINAFNIVNYEKELIKEVKVNTKLPKSVPPHIEVK